MSMRSQPVIAIFDVGKTNKKLFLFDQAYNIVYERSARFLETVDEDGDACENLESLRLSVFDSLRHIFSKKEFAVKAINFSAYGASFVYLDEEGIPLTPLYNYLKEYPTYLKDQFYQDYGGEEAFAMRTASPVLGSLNSGMQLYRIKYEKPEVYQRIKYALHLPQYLSYLISGKACSDITSIGCHTNLWDFTKNTYHEWVVREGIDVKLAPIAPYDKVYRAAYPGKNYLVGAGLHDSSAALIPYMVNFQEPFVLLSTGTWCISLHPFNEAPLTNEELKQDCLCYLTFQGRQVKASRLFAGRDHEEGVKRLADHFNRDHISYQSVEYRPEIIERLHRRLNATGVQTACFEQRDLGVYANYEEAYHQLMIDIVSAQIRSTHLVLKDSPVKRLFVDGGFSNNRIYMNLLANSFPQLEVYAASIAQATSLGTAIAIHHQWNKSSLSGTMIKLQYYAAMQDVVI